MQLAETARALELIRLISRSNSPTPLSTMASACQRLYPEPVPGGSLIGSVDSRFGAAAYTLSQTTDHIRLHSSIHSQLPKHASVSSTLPSETSQLECSVNPLTGVIQHLSRSKVEALVTQAWIRNIPNQPEDKLRDLVIGAVNKGILNQDDIQSTFTNTFSGLPTNVHPLYCNILKLDPTSYFIVFANSTTNCVLDFDQLRVYSSGTSSHTLETSRLANAISTDIIPS